MRRSALVPRVFCAAAFAALAFAVVGGQQPAPGAVPVFTAAQAQSGQAIYAQNCSACHGANFEGSGDAPALAGGTFRLKWGPKMVSELFGVILQTMPPTNPGSLGEAAALNATAYILQRNGAQPGQQALTAGRHDADRRRGHRPGAGANAQAPARGGRGAALPMVLGAGNRLPGTGRRRCRQAARRHGAGRSQELRAGDAGDAQESACRRTG